MKTSLDEWVKTSLMRMVWGGGRGGGGCMVWKCRVWLWFESKYVVPVWRRAGRLNLKR